MAELRAAAAWLVGRECWGLSYGYDLWLEFGPPRARWSAWEASRLASIPGNENAADDVQGSLQLVTDSAEWQIEHDGAIFISDEEEEATIATALGALSTAKPVVERCSVEYPSLALRVELSTGHVVVLTPESDADSEASYWSIRSVVFEGNPVSKPIGVSACPGPALETETISQSR